jgi:Subtilase family
MQNKPLLIFPTPTISGRQKKKIPPPSFHYPAFDRQRERLVPQFGNIGRAFEARRAELLMQPTGAIPEQVLVLETVGTVDDFMNAVRSIPGMEWLGEWDEEDIPPDEDFYSDEEHREKLLRGRLYLVMTNQSAISELLSMWDRYKADPAAALQHGRAKWKKMFQLLREIRPWGPEDRLLDTGILHDWKIRIEKGFEVVRFETELWYKENEATRSQSAEVIRRLLSDKGGTLIRQSILPEIRYHGILAELPVSAIQEVIDNPTTQLVRCDQVMFFRPSGQAAVGIPQDEPLPGSGMPELLGPSGSPLIALLDGLPLENHELLAGRLIIDDPDNWGRDYPPHERFHGTAMASLIVHDELDSGQIPLNTPVYVRPILKPDSRDWRDTRAESVPEDELPIDLVHRAVKRMIEGERGEPPVAPTVKIVNLSVCDPSRPLVTYLSPWARLLDWLSWRYNLLFIVSVGNQVEDIELSTEREELRRLGAQELEAEVIRSIARNYMRRRILSPSEAINAISVAGSNEDLAPAREISPLISPLSSAAMPSPINSLGLGFRRSIKPDIIYRGGKQLFLERPGNTHDKAILRASPTSLSPGQRAASPGRRAGDLSATRYSRGTSNAAALTSRIATQLYAVLDNLRRGSTAETIDERYIPVLLKALAVHSANWDDTQGILENLIKPISQPRKLRENISRFLGYGHIMPDRVYSCTDQRATLIGFSSIGHDEGHRYSVPLPPSLSGQRTWRRLIITLAWFTPINPSHRAYRRAALWFDPPKDELQVDRTESDWQAVKRGTVQHEILEGEKASAFVEDQALEILINCRADAGDLTDTVPYAVVATLEVAEGIEIPIYDEIQTRIRPVVPIRPTPV